VIEKDLVKNIFERSVPGVAGILSGKIVGIAGCGGLGSNVAVALARAGIGKLILADYDVVEASNLNRQHYFIEDIGKKKAEALSSLLKRINPQIELELLDIKLTKENVSSIFKDAHLMVEAFDRAESKAWLIETWCVNFPDRIIVCASGLSGLGHTSSLKVRRSGRIIVCGDGETDMSMGLTSARVAIVANMQANEAIEALVTESKNKESNQDQTKK
jgi:sulfur carrier protein ThiS adenylyltransferase